MPIDSGIALGFKPHTEIQDPMNSLAKFLQVQGLQQQGEMHRMQADEYRSGVQRKNKLNELTSRDYATPEALESELVKNGYLTEAGALGTQRRANAQSDVNIAKGKVDLFDAKYKQSRAYLDMVKTPEQLIAWYEANHRDPVMGPELARRGQTGEQVWASIKQAQATPGGFEALVKQTALGMEKYTQVAETERSHRAAEGHQAATLAESKRHSGVMEGHRGAEVGAGGKPPPGYTWDGPGQLKAIPGGPGDKLPEKQQNTVIGAQNLSNAIAEYRKELEGWKKTGALSPSARAAMGTKHKNLMLQAKEAFNLGVLNGPDLEIMNGVITDPLSFTGALTPNAALDKQAVELDRIFGDVARVSGNRRPQDGAPPKAAKLGGAAPNQVAGGVIDFGDLK